MTISTGASLTTTWLRVLATASTLAVVASFAAPAMAQSAPDSAPADDGNEDIVVTGSIVAAQGESVRAKRDAVNLTRLAAFLTRTAPPRSLVCPPLLCNAIRVRNAISRCVVRQTAGPRSAWTASR